VKQTGPRISSFGLDQQGIRHAAAVRWNLTDAELYEQALRRHEASVAQGGALVVLTGVHTGRSPNDKYIVREPSCESKIWWGNVNRPIDPAKYAALYRQVMAYYQGRELFVQDCWGGADARYRIGVRVVTETAWHSLFARNMFLVPREAELTDFRPDFTILHAPNLLADPAVDGTRTGTFIILNFAERVVLIGGTSYAGEIKKSVFSILNYLLPDRQVLPMHCSVNVGNKTDSAVFFGLSGTGKTTLSADPHRRLVGDDEHGWSQDGLFNFEGGCYAKVIKLSADAEPEIFATTQRFGTILENVVMDPVQRTIDLDSQRYTENTRASYPIAYIPNTVPSGLAGHPKNIVMLTADAFGVLPPIAKLSADQAMYHFLSGYTARVAGTEKGMGNEPQATFSTCFGAPFMPRHPSVYAELLGERIVKHRSTCWLVNTGWTGGAFGVGKRMSIKYTRALLSAAMRGDLDSVPFVTDRHFGLQVPERCAGVPTEVLNPRATWADKGAYDTTAARVVTRFHENFEQFAKGVSQEIRDAAPRAA